MHCFIPGRKDLVLGSLYVVFKNASQCLLCTLWIRAARSSSVLATGSDEYLRAAEVLSGVHWEGRGFSCAYVKVMISQMLPVGKLRPDPVRKYATP